jgi:hypothetical protein
LAKIPTTDGTVEFHLRPGQPPFGQLGWRGVNTESDPSSLDPNELQFAQDVRLRGKSIITRWALDINNVIDLGAGVDDLENRILGVLEAPVDNPRVRIWMTARGCFGGISNTGATLMRFDPSERPQFQNYGLFNTVADYQMPMGKYGGSLYIGDRDKVRRVAQITPHPNMPTSAFVYDPSYPTIASFSGYLVRCLIEFDSKLFIGLENSGAIGNSKIAVYDGQQVKDDITGIRPPLAFGIYQNKLVAGFDSTAGNIRVRSAGDAPGTWNTFALAGFQCATQNNSIVENRQYVYIASGIDKIFRFDGTNLTLVRTVAGCDTTGFGVTALTRHRSLLYYLWNAPATFASKLGRHDPDSTGVNEFIDTYKDITADQANFIRGSSLLSYRNQIYVGGQHEWLVCTAVNDVKGSLEVLNDTGAGAGFMIEQMVRFP